MDATTWLQRCRLALPSGAVGAALGEVTRVVEEAKKASLPATPQALDRLYRYRVPKLSADGSCSLIEELDPTPYDLAASLGGRSLDTSLRLVTLHALVEAVARHTEAAWLGVYQVRHLPSGRALVKLAAVGVESRAEFPLTEAFGRHSNNVAVALSGVARVIDDVREHASAGGAYYECDPAVRAEACLPLLDDTGAVVGLLDAEATEPAHFTPPRLAQLAALALEAPRHLPR